MRSFLAGSALALVLVAAGCGGSGSATTTTTTTTGSGNGMASKPAPQVLAAAVKAADSASSLHMSGNISGKNPVGIDLSIAKGNGATGSMTINGHKVDLEIIGQNGYLKGDGSFWTQFGGSSGAMIAQLLQGKWLKFPANSAQFHPLVAYASSKAIFDALKSGAGGNLMNNGATTYKGQSVVALYDGAKKGTFYVAATGTPYPVALVKTGSGGGTIAFSQWNQPVTLTAPTNVLDFSQITGG